jgi:hypothetical protein
MNPGKPLILRVLVVIFAISLLGGYVVFSQTRAKPRVSNEPSSKSGPVSLVLQTASNSSKDGETAMPGSKLGRVFSEARIVGDFSEPVRSEEEEEEQLAEPSQNGTLIFSTKSAVPIFPSKTLQLQVLPANSQQTNPVVAPGSKIMFHVVPPSTVDSLFEKKPAPVNAPGSKGAVPLIPREAIAPQSVPEKPAAPRSFPGSKSIAPLFRVEPPAKTPAKQEPAR